MGEMMSSNTDEGSSKQPMIVHVGSDSEYAHLSGDDFVRDSSRPLLHAEEAAAHGQETLARFLGGKEQLDKVLGRPSLEATEPGGVSPNRQVRLGPELDQELTRWAQAHQMTRSAIIRRALTEFFHQGKEGKASPA